VLGRVVTFMAGGWLTMSAFAWPQSDVACTNTWVAGALCIGYSLLAIFVAPARYLNTAHACMLCVMSLSLEASSAATANNVMVAAVIFGGSLLGAPAASGQGAARAWAVAGSKASSTGCP
jgi:hypothetical protein